MRNEPLLVSIATRPASVGGAYLYLDFDGVLHHEDVRSAVSARRGGTHRKIYFGPSAFGQGTLPVLFEHADILESLLAPYPHVKIVLSTSWVSKLGYSKTRRRLPLALRRRVVGATFHSFAKDFEARPREQQILEDVARRGPKAWVALDDDLLESASALNWIKTNPITGLGDTAIKAKAAEIFQRLFG